MPHELALGFRGTPPGGALLQYCITNATVSVTINTILILNCDGNPHIWVYGVSNRVLTRLAGV